MVALTGALSDVTVISSPLGLMVQLKAGTYPPKLVFKVLISAPEPLPSAGWRQALSPRWMQEQVAAQGRHWPAGSPLAMC